MIEQSIKAIKEAEAQAEKILREAHAHAQEIHNRSLQESADCIDTAEKTAREQYKMTTAQYRQEELELEESFVHSDMSSSQVEEFIAAHPQLQKDVHEIVRHILLEKD